MNNNNIPSSEAQSSQSVQQSKPQPQPASQSQLQSQRRDSKTKGQYTLGITLGEGAFAKVKLATHNPTQEKIAIKIINKSHLLKEEKDVIRIKKEISILKTIRHKNIIQLYEIMESKSSLYIVMEYCEGKELYDHIVQKKRLNEEETCRYFQQIINAVEYLHDQGIIHRDLKPENILLDDKLNIKISDFGLSTFYSKGQLLITPCGTPSYAPPEMLKGEQYNGESSDVWSCGIILYAMLCGKLPFAESQEDLICKRIIDKDYVIPDFVPKEARNLLIGILNVDPKERFTIEQIKRHPWFNFISADLRPGIALGKQTPPIDENILKKVQLYGYDSNKCRQNLMCNKFNSLTSVYYLLLKQYIKQGGKSISDLASDDYLRYIIDLNTNNNANAKEANDNTQSIEASENNSPCLKKIEGKIISKFHSNYLLPTNAANATMQINNKNNNGQIVKESFVSSFIATNKKKKNKGTKGKLHLQPQTQLNSQMQLNQPLPQSKTQPSKAPSNVTSIAVTTPSSTDISNKQLHLAKHALYKKTRQELTKLKKSHQETTESNQLNSNTNTNTCLSCITPQLNPFNHNDTCKEFTVNEGNKNDDDDEDLLFEEELNNIESMSKNNNILQFIAQKLIGNPFYGSFDISMSSRKNQLENKFKIKLKGEDEESKEDNVYCLKHNTNANYDEIDDDEEEKGLSIKPISNNLKPNVNHNANDTITLTTPTKTLDIEGSKHKKTIKHSFIKKQEVFIYDYSGKNNNCTGKGIQEHKSQFLDISTTQLENSIERSISVNKDLRRFSLSPDKNLNTKHKDSEDSIKTITLPKNHLKKCKKGYEWKNKPKNKNKVQRIDTIYTAQLGSIQLTKSNHHHSNATTSKKAMNSNNINNHTDNTNSTDNLFKSINSNKTITSTVHSTNTNTNANDNAKTINATKQRNSANNNQLINRDKLIPHPNKKTNESIEISFDKSIKHVRTGSANESILQKTILDNKVKINLNELTDNSNANTNTNGNSTKVFNSICFNEVKNAYESIKVYKGPIDVMCCCSLAPKLLYTYLLNLFKTERFNCVKVSLTQLRCSKAALTFDCEVMLLECNVNGTCNGNGVNGQSNASYVKIRFKQGDILAYRKMLTSIGQSIQMLG